MSQSNRSPLPSWYDIHHEFSLPNADESPANPRQYSTDADKLQAIWKRFDRWKRAHVGCLDRAADELFAEVQAELG
jgi:hypothetical protein